MTRVHEAYEALERARKTVLITDVPNPGAQADKRDDSWAAGGGRLSDFRPEPRAYATPPHPSVADTAVRRADGPPVPSRVCLRCPVCAHVFDGRRWPAWILKLLHLVHIAPYRCGVCGYRSSRLESETGPSDPIDRDRTVFQAFLVPDDQRSLGEVIRAIARDERQPDGDSGAPKV
jgi:hypothetical protein